MPALSRPSKRRLLAVSHPAVVGVNQQPYAELQTLGWKVHLVVPSKWQHEYSQQTFAAARDPRLGAAVEPLPVLFRGRPQRHFYLVRPSHVIRRSRPDVVFLEQEPFSIAGFQWSTAAWRAGIPFGFQADENLNRSMPLAAQRIREWTLPRTAFIAARSPAAAALVRQWGAQGRVEIVPHPVPAWDPFPISSSDRVFTVGYAGRLVEEKGLRDLVAALALMKHPARLLAVGNGPMLPYLQDSEKVEVVTTCPHEEMPRAYARMDLLVLPSRRTPTWEEQFGRVLVEALHCGVPVLGSRTGEIQWVINTTGGGWTFEERDIIGLATILDTIATDPAARRNRALAGQAAVGQRFSMGAVTKQMDALLSDIVLEGGANTRTWPA